ncbi:sugar ABC transporter ATP-binding protein [Solwaraspora sp. WMMD406]|uniref:ATP-binding cassette domain-containing protein n=1 Tax=Solwaraspora sp. WMMD406 TaxID=3016095 RepID=UPI00241688B9|nr:sugar ABC transporter ATP-binding protein [Solwaraspora sp. WMMD406]MDG4767997.1 sugar ABC transporter ATP-binding protein [Solwaraspora sp. WMMD406]
MASTDVDTTSVLSLDGVTKVFGELVALDHVDLDVAPHQIHALLGANGSGKSTLVKVMSGVYQPDGGAMVMDGARLASFGSPAGAAERGVRVVHQEAPLIDSLTVAEAVAMFRGYGTRNLAPIAWGRLRRHVQALLDRMDVPVRATDLCGSLGPADRAGLALAIVVGDLFDESRNSSPTVRLLIVDEVTAAIPESETGRHLERLRAVADMGVGVVMVTHRMAELRVADDITVLRAGHVVYREAGGPRRPNNELVAEMVGEKDTAAGHSVSVSERTSDRLSQLWNSAPTRHEPQPGERPTPAIEVSGLHGGHLRDCSFTATAGEIVGFAGLRGSGVEDLPRLLSGDLAWRDARVELPGVTFTEGGDPRRMIAAGLTAIAADRLRAGGVPALTVEENVVLPALGRYWHRPQLQDRVVRAVIRAFDVRPPTPESHFGGLSGGNQQKVLLGKWLLMRPTVLVLGDPTYGVDPAARETIFEATQDAASRGVCVLFFSTEPEQLVRICNRVIVLRNGKIGTELSGADLTLENLVERSEQ